MKIRQSLCLGVAIVSSQLALAKLPFTNDVFGKSEGTLDFCAQVDSASAPKYQARKRALVRDVPDKEVTEARTTKEYKEAYEWMTTELKKVPQDQAVQACTAALDSK